MHVSGEYGTGEHTRPTPRSSIVDSVLHHLIEEEAPVPRVNRAVRAQAEIALLVLVARMLRGAALQRGDELRDSLRAGELSAFLNRTHAVRRLSKREPCERLHERLAVSPRVLDGARGVGRLDELQCGEVSVLGVREVQVVATEVLPDRASASHTAGRRGGALTVPGTTRRPPGCIR